MSMETAKLAVNMLCNGDVGSAQQVANVLFDKGLTRGGKPVHHSTVIRHAKRAAAAEGQPIVATNALSKTVLTVMIDPVFIEIPGLP